ncbi:MAG: tRNA 2-thiouridine(34) synthase MnmA [Acidimicrobiia bacterium]|nr:tRNA 2-thiouridine(34) synthase MnmA [Acidimicrobiia bacterium]MDX2466968.1 tRNA 2-thiouridine(34) synthase MnmA [Acidimicrobiia bacterium]
MRALVAMSGGVDSSVAAALMLDQGHEVIGVTLKQWEGADGEMPLAGCCTVSDSEDARRVASQLDVPYYVLDYVDEFTEKVVDHFGEMYAAGKTPNPCIECNRRVRFSVLLERTAALGCDVLVTGHHARIRHDDAGYHLIRAVDGTKDQSYVLHMLKQEDLAKVRLPVGEMTKTKVREYAAQMGLRTADKPDSQDLCFVGEGSYRDFIRSRFPEAARPGPLVMSDGTYLAQHEGMVDFTIGQRRGLGVALGDRRYVVDINPDTSTVVLGTKEELLTAGCLVEDVSFIAGSAPSEAAISVKIRYRSEPVAATLTAQEPGWSVRFDKPQLAVAPGQAAVFYSGDEVLGGGTISKAIR